MAPNIEQSGMRVDVAKFKGQLRRLSRDYSLNAGQVLKDQFRLWCVDNLRNFPPSGNMLKQPAASVLNMVGVKLSATEARRILGAKSDKALGERAVARDVHGTLGIKTIV